MLITKFEQVKTIIKQKMNQSEGAGTIVHEDNCAFLLRSEFMDARWMKQAKIVTPKSSKIQQCPGSLGVFAGNFL